MPLYSSSSQAMRSSEIRRLMKLAADPSIISFAGGMPNNDLFPVAEIDELLAALPAAEKKAAFQYGPTQGYPPLLDELKRYLCDRGLPVDSNDLIITTGAQQGINLLAKVFLDPGDTVIAEYPSFIGALAAFKSYGAEMVGCNIDSEGIIIDELQKSLDIHKRTKIVYLNPCFQNPGGILYSHKRKQDVLNVLSRRDVCLLEDDPYSELYFSPADKNAVTPMLTMANGSGTIAYAGSFAKILGPGMRLGWILAPSGVVAKCELAKQSMDACSSTYTQVIAAAYLRNNRLASYLDFVRPIYARRAQLMLDGLIAGMPEEVSWTTPRGGFYVWVTLPEGADSTLVFDKALKRGAAFVIGSAFDPRGVRNNCFRLAFSHTPENRIGEGVALVCQAVHETLND